MPRRAPDTAAGTRARWDRRIARAHELAGQHASTAGILTFYAALAERQRDLALTARDRADDPDIHFREALDIEPALAAIPDLLGWLASAAPPALAAAARRLAAGATNEAWRDTTRACVADEAEPVTEAEHAMDFVAVAVVQPLAERLARSRESRGAVPDAPSGDAACRLCGGAPLVGVLREEAHGAKRGLICGFCLSESDYRRVVCPSCNEQTFEALPIYTADAFDHVRIEACDTCRTYLKTIDLTVNGLAEPVVDDLASVAMDLWARERGYQRLRPNLLRI